MAGLKGKIALITGAGGMKGVGRATALKFAQHGVDVVLTDVARKPQDVHPGEVRAGWQGLESVAGEVRALEGRCLTIPCDLGDRDQMKSLVKQAVEHFGRIDILVNNARAIIGKDRVPVTELAEDVWDHFIAINTSAVFVMTKLVGREMVRQGKGGRIINIASNASKQASAMGTAYSASKFAVLGITQASALDLAPYGITVNAICPGPINSNRLSYWEQAKAQEQGMSLEEFRAGIVDAAARATPLGRIAEPEDVANMAVFLASDEAGFITGQAYNVNGGLLFH